MNARSWVFCGLCVSVCSFVIELQRCGCMKSGKTKRIQYFEKCVAPLVYDMNARLTKRKRKLTYAHPTGRRKEKQPRIMNMKKKSRINKRQLKNKTETCMREIKKLFFKSIESHTSINFVCIISFLADLLLRKKWNEMNRNEQNSRVIYWFRYKAPQCEIILYAYRNPNNTADMIGDRVYLCLTGWLPPPPHKKPQ